MMELQKHSSFIFFFVILGMFNDVWGAQNYFVTPNGSNNGDGTESNPWPTIEKAIFELRKIRKGKTTDHVTVNLMAGTHYMSQILWMNKKDSNMSIVAHNDADVSISGGVQENLVWTKQGDHLSARFAGSCPSEAFQGDFRLLSARSPNIKVKKNQNVALEPYHYIHDLLQESDTCKRQSNWFSQSGCPEINRHGFIFKDDSNSNISNWNYLDQTRLLIFHSWIAEYVDVANVTDLGNGLNQIMFKNPLKHAKIGEWNKPSRWRFLPFNNLALLDEPGEYVCVQENNEAIFTYIPLNNEKLTFSNLAVMIFMVRVSNFQFHGIKFKHSSSLGKDGYGWGAEAAIKIAGGQDIDIENCEFSQIGTTGLWLKKTSRLNVQNNNFLDIGYHGIQSMYKSYSEVQEDIKIKNNLFNGCGISNFWQPACVLIEGSKNIEVSNNEMTNGPNHLIAIRGNYRGDKYWTDLGISEPTRDDYIFHIEYNHLHHYGLGVTSDYGAVYIGTPINCMHSSEEEVRKHCFSYIHVYNNLIHDVRDAKDGGTFIYNDSGSCKNTFENNIMYGSGSFALYHHCGLENVSKNNIVHRTSSSSDHALNQAVGGCEKTSTAGLYQSYTNSHNIYYLDNAKDFALGRDWDRFYDPLRPNDTVIFHHNLYYSAARTDDLHLMKFPGGTKQNPWIWSQWVSPDSGQDKYSKWANPKFSDPYSNKYELAEDSPALELGIKQINLDNFGIQKSQSDKDF